MKRKTDYFEEFTIEVVRLVLNREEWSIVGTMRQPKTPLPHSKRSGSGCGAQKVETQLEGSILLY